MPQFVLAQLIAALAWILNALLSTYFWVVLIAALLSWVNPDPRNPIVRFLYSVTEPVLYQIRRRLPFVRAGGLDFSPLLLLLAIRATQMVVVRSLYELSVRVQAALPGALHVG